MAEPTTVNRGFIIPNTGDLVGQWGTAAVNPNMQSLDGLFGGAVTIPLSAATTLALTNSTGAPTASAGPFQQQNALIKFSGTLTGNAVIQFSAPGFYIVHNACTVGSFYVQLAPSAGTGNAIGAPPGRKCHVFFDGTNMDYVNMPEVGAALDLHGATAVPAWMSACTVAPYLVKDGRTYTASVYPALSALLGSTFGGNGASTFAVPDERSRARIGLDTNGPGTFANRVTVAGSGINGTTMGAAGGDQLLQQHTHTYTDPSHAHGLPSSGGGSAGGGGNFIGGTIGAFVSNTALIGIIINNAGTGAGQNMMPTIVSFLPLIKT
jgi:microcystin-dependent protein